ncbi:MAG: type II secretion system protein GspG [Candidatus Staskawiczbacteria bacterium]|nr:type II secretion system protein GspG [Candidatus Staskawiczbacteria bacterium]
MNNIKKTKGFTIIEIVVVIAIIAVLAGIVMVNVSSFTKKAKVTAARADVRQLVIAMELYRAKNGQLPPLGDSCSACSNPCDAGVWNAVVDAMINSEDGNRGMYIDPWGRPFCYDDNDKVPAGPCSPVFSMGEDGVNNTGTGCAISGDDIGQILPYGGP